MSYYDMAGLGTRAKLEAATAVGIMAEVAEDRGVVWCGVVCG